jgi:hypothetical protein
MQPSKSRFYNHLLGYIYYGFTGCGFARLGELPTPLYPYGILSKMNKHFYSALLSLTFALVFMAPAQAQYDLDEGAGTSSAFNTAGDTGDRSHNTSTTSLWQDIDYTPADGNIEAPEFQTDQGTVRTFKGNWGDVINAPSIKRTQSGLMAPSSVNTAPIPTTGRPTHYDFGFKRPGNTTGIYNIIPGVSSGKMLPQTSLGSLEFSVVDGARAPGPPAAP